MLFLLSLFRPPDVNGNARSLNAALGKEEEDDGEYGQIAW